MKKTLSLLLVLVLCLGCSGCGASGSSEDSGQEVAAELPKNIQMYVPGTTIETDFGSVTVMDAAFTAKAQIYYTKSSTSHKSTVNGKTTESYKETIHPGYISTMDNKMVFALKTVMINNTSQDIEIQKLSVKATFVENSPVYFSKGGNFHISDEAYKILPAGGSSEIILAALLPVDQYLLASQCLLEVGGAKLGFSYDSIQVYNALGFQEGDNTAVTIDEVIQAAASSAPSHSVPAETEAEPTETEPELETSPGVSSKTGTSKAEGRALVIENVALGFREKLPAHILDRFDHSIDKLTLNSSQIYAAVRFSVTNLTTETVDLADLHDDFLVQLNYDNGYLYSTNTDVYSVYESGANMKMLRSNGSSGSDISVSPLVTADVTVYIPCARQVAENTDKSLTVSFISKYAGSESLEFQFPGRTYHGADQTAESASTYTDPDVVLFSGINRKTGTSGAEGRALAIDNVAVGFRKQLPEHILENFDHNADKLTLNDTQTYAVIHFTATNLTTDTVDLADLHDDFLVQLNYNNGYRYSTNTDVYAVYESGANMKMVRSNSSSGNDIAVSPLTSADVVVYIPCAAQVADSPDKPLTASFVSKYSGHESFDFTFDRSTSAG